MRIYKTGYVLSLEEERRTAHKDFKCKSEGIFKSTTIDDIRRSGASYYKYVTSSSDTCETCAGLHGMAFHISDAEERINLPPIHPHCKCDIEPYNFEDELSFRFSSDNPGGATPNDWKFFGWSGDEFNSEPDKIYTNDYFGKAISPDGYKELHVVDFIARLIFHEDSDARAQAGIAWTIFNRTQIKTGFTLNGRDPNLMNILIERGQYGVYEERHNSNPQSPNFYNPVEWINSLSPPYRQQQQKSWDNALRLAKLIVSAYGNPDLSEEGRRSVFKEWIPNPFPKTNADGNTVSPEDVTYFFSLPKTTKNKPISLGTDNKFGYTWRN